ncbi:MAG: hypothetical protein LBE09_02430 [Christensenellaceae bacterium]|jgi:hypothetical protein|nr:hypothetical protein [Christensenellaceae bacterium]
MNVATKSKKKIIIIAVVIFLVIAIASGSVCIILFTGNIDVPNPVIQLPAVGSSAQVVVLNWDAVEDAIGYIVQYKYAIKGDEIIEIKVKSPSVSIERIKGELNVRVSSCAKYVNRDSQFSEWVKADIPGIKLLAPSFRVTYAVAGDDGYYNVLRETWNPTTYTYKEVTKEVVFYQMCVVPPGKTLENQLMLGEEYDSMMGVEELLGYRIHGGSPGQWRLYIRAINTKGRFGNFGEIEGEPAELYYLFETGDWSYVEFLVI